jgi:GAF domain-containing protein
LTHIENLYEKSYEQALEMLTKGHSKDDILSFLTKAAEQAAGADTVSSILLLDGEGLLRNGASPRLPKDYLKAIDGLKPHPMVGTCASAAATGNMVITLDFYEDSKWAELKHLPSALGFKGAWSLPIKNESGKVLGTFGTYFSKKRMPSESEIDGIHILVKAAVTVLETGSN